MTKAEFKDLASPDEIREFENEVSTYFLKIFNHQTQIRTLTALRDTLLSKLMSGEVSVSNFGEVRVNINEEK